MSEEELQLLVTLDDPEGAPEEDTFNHSSSKKFDIEVRTVVRNHCPARPGGAFEEPLECDH
jgi:hypothetical protein